MSIEYSELCIVHYSLFILHYSLFILHYCFAFFITGFAFFIIRFEFFIWSLHFLFIFHLSFEFCIIRDSLIRFHSESPYGLLGELCMMLLPPLCCCWALLGVVSIVHDAIATLMLLLVGMVLPLWIGWSCIFISQRYLVTFLSRDPSVVVVFVSVSCSLGFCGAMQYWYHN